MCFYGWLVPKLSLITIGWVLAYTVAWVFVMDIIKLVTYAVANHKAGWQTKHRSMVHQPLGLSGATTPAASPTQ